MIHPTAVVSPLARIHPDAIIGPWCLVEGDVQIGAGTELKRGVSVYGPVEIGEHNVIGAQSVIGSECEDATHRSQPGPVSIGHRNVLCEFVTISHGSTRGSGRTTLGDDNLLMTYTHVAHDCSVGSRCRMTAYAGLSGHSSLGDDAVLCAKVAVAQYVRVGRMAFVTARTLLTRDVPPACIAHGSEGPTRLSGANLVGLKRHGWSREAIQTARQLAAHWTAPGRTQAQALTGLSEAAPSALRDEWLAFIADSSQGVLR